MEPAVKLMLLSITYWNISNLLKKTVPAWNEKFKKLDRDRCLPGRHEMEARQQSLATCVRYIFFSLCRASC